MTKQRSTKRALLMSALSLLLCMAMLVGTTYAWFTDTAVSAGNKIVAGTLDVDLLMYDGKEYADISESKAAIFGNAESLVAQNNNSDTLWEPGKTQVAYLAIKNNGNLALKYTVALNVVNPEGGKDLYKAMEYVISPNKQNGEITAWDDTNAKEVTLGSQTVSNGEGEMKPGDTHYFALSVHMKEEAGNEYQGGMIDFDLTVLATQLASESDSFDNSYDNKAVYEEDVQVEAVPWHELDAVKTDTEIDGGGYTYATEYQEICLAGDADITVKGVTFQNGLTVYTNGDVSGTVTLENCTIYLNDGSANPTNANLSQYQADYGLYIGAIDKDVSYVFKNCTFTAYDNHTYTNASNASYNAYIGGNYSAESVTFDGCTFEGSGKHGIGCSYAYSSDTNNPFTYYNFTVTGCNFVDWNNNNQNGAAIRGNVPADVLADYNKTINISGNTFGNSNSSTKNTVAIDGWDGTWN